MSATEASSASSNIENNAMSCNIPQIEIFSGGDVQVTVGKIISGRISRINDLYVDKLGLNDADYYELFKTIDIKNIQVSAGGTVDAVGRDNQSYEILYVSDVPDGSLGVQLMPNKSAFLSTSSLTSSSSSSAGERCDGLKVVSISKEYLEIMAGASSSLPLRLNDVIVKVNSVPLSNLSADAAVKIFKSSLKRKLVVMREKNISVKSSGTADYTGFNSYDYFGITANGKEDVLQSDDAVEMNRRSSAYANIADGNALLNGSVGLRNNWLSLRQRYVDRTDAASRGKAQGKRKAAADLPTVQERGRSRHAGSSSSLDIEQSDRSEYSSRSTAGSESEGASSVQITDISENEKENEDESK